MALSVMRPSAGAEPTSEEEEEAVVLKSGVPTAEEYTMHSIWV
jgi:hypothetical protein